MDWKRRKKKTTHINQLEEETLEEVMEFVGKNKEVYKKKWSKFKQDKKGIQYSWNWAALVFGVYWFAYRKMNGYAYFILGIWVLVDLVLIITTKQASSNTSSFLGMFIIIALLSNQSYLDFVIKKVKKLKKQYPNKDERLEMIKKRGGISWINVFVFLLAMIVYIYTISIVEQTVYYNYIEPKFEKAIELQEKGNFKEAIAIYEDLENKDIPVPEIHYNLAAIYFTIGDLEKAEDEINAYLEFIPDDKSAKQLKQEILIQKSS